MPSLNPPGGAPAPTGLTQTFLPTTRVPNSAAALRFIHEIRVAVEPTPGGEPRKLSRAQWGAEEPTVWRSQTKPGRAKAKQHGPTFSHHVDALLPLFGQLPPRRPLKLAAGHDAAALQRSGNRTRRHGWHVSQCAICVHRSLCGCIGMLCMRPGFEPG